MWMWGLVNIKLGHPDWSTSFLLNKSFQSEHPGPSAWYLAWC